MSEPLSTEDRAALEQIVRALEAAWNAADGDAFAAPFAEDADFVTIRAEHMRGRMVIAQGHDGIFRTIYAGSTIQCTVESMRRIGDTVALVHVRSVLEAPQGPMAGRNGACFSIVATKLGDVWRIASFHNTAETQRR